jgi:hypothetical protein
MSFFRTLFFRKKRAPLACTMDLDEHGHHTHTDACFVEIAPLSIVELYQSQGCESCPPAIPLIHSAVNANHNALLLTYNVTYWDARTGWRDTHGNAQWDARQKAYVTRWGRKGVFTPQVIVDGIADGVGRREGEVQEIMGKAMETRNGMDWAVGIEAVSGGLKIASEKSEAETFDVLVIFYKPGSETVKVEKGPNKRKKMVHVNTVRDIVKVEEWSGGYKIVPLPDFGNDGLEKVAVVQGSGAGPIVAALKL